MWGKKSGCKNGGTKIGGKKNWEFCRFAKGTLYDASIILYNAYTISPNQFNHRVLVVIRWIE